MANAGTNKFKARLATARGRAIRFLIRHAGGPRSARTLEQLRNLANYALGIGSASGLTLEESGEAKLLGDLARRWSSRPELTVVDVGANTGDYARATRKAFGPRASIHCFEPQQASFETLTQAVTDEVEIHCHRLALGSEPGTATLFSDSSSSPLASLHEHTFVLTQQLDPPTNREEVTVDTLDRVADRLGLAGIDLLKIDVEGHDSAVLAGAAELLERGAIEVIQFEFGERNLFSRTFLKDFVELLGPGYDLYRLSPRGLARIEYRPAAEVFLLETNYVAIKRLGAPGSAG